VIAQNKEDLAKTNIYNSTNIQFRANFYSCFIMEIDNAQIKEEILSINKYNSLFRQRSREIIRSDYKSIVSEYNEFPLPNFRG
jgi:hypothetical protein